MDPSQQNPYEPPVRAELVSRQPAKPEPSPVAKAGETIWRAFIILLIVVFILAAIGFLQIFMLMEAGPSPTSGS
jgi:hypothetical protein